MNKEESKVIPLRQATYEELTEVITDLHTQNYLKEMEIVRLNNIINKAIEFIYENSYDEERETCIDDLWGEIPKLLDILKGSDKE